MREAVLALADDELAAMGIGELHEHCRAAGLRDLEELDCRGDGAVVLATVEEPLDASLLDDLPYVEAWERVADDGDLPRYRIAFTAPGVPETARDAATDLVGECDPELERDGTTLSLVGPQPTIGDAVAAYEDAGANPDLRELGSYDGREHPLDALTDRQREVLATAWDLGYFEVPREASTADVGAALDLDDSTVTEHLQRAQRNLLAELLEG